MTRVGRSSIRLLVSVRSTCEAQAALRGGADIIDFKEPKRGPLGRVENAVIESCLSEVEKPPSLLWTAALGELVDLRGSGANLYLPSGIDYFKVGTTRLRSQPGAKDLFLAIADTVERVCGQPALVPTAYADAVRCSAPDAEVIVDWAIESRAPFLLVDTAVKDGRGFWHWYTEDRLRILRGRCQQAGIGLVIAGALDEHAMTRLIDLGVDIVAVRGAVCQESNRQATIEEGRVRDFAQLLHQPTVS